tara:strand:- start:6753 stop:7307 length:555 start_codon:yes stop_codon:yes gene_type:complete
MKRKNQSLNQMDETNNLLLRIALETKFNPADIDNVLKVISATGNSSVASTILLGKYEEPKFLPHCKDCSRKVNKTFMGYDPFKCEVVYTYNSITNKQAWFKVGDEPIEENIVSSKHYSEDAMDEIGYVSDSEDKFKTFKENYTWKTWKSTISDVINTHYMGVDEWIANQIQDSDDQEPEFDYEG